MTWRAISARPYQLGAREPRANFTADLGEEEDQERLLAGHAGHGGGAGGRNSMGYFAAAQAAAGGKA